MLGARHKLLVEVHVRLVVTLLLLSVSICSRDRRLLVSVNEVVVLQREHLCSLDTSIVEVGLEDDRTEVVLNEVVQHANSRLESVDVFLCLLHLTLEGLNAVTQVVNLLLEILSYFLNLIKSLFLSLVDSIVELLLVLRSQVVSLDSSDALVQLLAFDKLLPFVKSGDLLLQVGVSNFAGSLLI